MTLTGDAQINVVPHYKGKGRPARGRKPDTYVYRIEGGLASIPQERIRRLERKTCAEPVEVAVSSLRLRSGQASPPIN